MPWQPQADNVVISAGTTVRVVYGNLCLGVITDADRRAAFANAPFSIVSFDDFGFSPAITIMLNSNMSAGQIRSLVQSVFDELRARWSVACAFMEVKEISTFSGGVIPTVPTSTAISIAGVAIIALVGFLVYRNFISLR